MGFTPDFANLKQVRSETIFHNINLNKNLAILALKPVKLLQVDHRHLSALCPCCKNGFAAYRDWGDLPLPCDNTVSI